MSDLPTDFEIEREFGLSHYDFFRIFPRIEPTFVKISERIVEVQRDDGRQLQIEISAEKMRHFATLKIPYINISFRFAGWSDIQRAEFFKKFDLSFQKGGG